MTRPKPTGRQLNVAQTRSFLLQAWDRAVAEYRAGCINVECTLQAVMFGELRRAFHDQQIEDCRVICEPKLSLPDPQAACEQVLIPDLVVFSGQDIVAAVELKFIPWYLVEYEDDLYKLGLLAHAAAHGIPPKVSGMRLEPATGKEADATWRVAPDCVLAFGAVARKDSAGLYLDSLNAHQTPALKERFLPLLYAVG